MDGAEEEAGGGLGVGIGGGEREGRDAGEEGEEMREGGGFGLC